ncbi:MAG TPA: phage tail tube protein [Anaerohalosphaeraceae bacterium]|nr:phage tail tube protein [Anaerohalosphaeraceae bacterium]
MATTYKLGMEAVILYQTPAAADPSTLDPSSGGGMTALTNVRDVTINHETGEADITTRGNQGWRATAATLRECSVEFEMVWKPGDTGFEAIKNAWLNSGEISLAIISEDPDTVGAEGPCGNFSITNFSRSEPLEEAITVSVTAKLSNWGKWYKKA